MLFNSYIFLFLFLPGVLVGYRLLARSGMPRLSVYWLIAASLLFYGWWDIRFLGLLLLSYLMNAAIGALLLRPFANSQRRMFFIAGLAFNLGLLGYFKYTNFFISTLNNATDVNWALLDITLPLGISFFIFQKIAFLTDAYTGRLKSFQFTDFSLFVFFFPQLIAGPITHHREMLPQFAALPHQRDPSRDLAIGLSIFILGLVKKVVLADQLAHWADPVFATAAQGQSPGIALAWIGVLAYTFQIYFDFSGYSDMALGLARMFGITLPLNFFSPYKSASITDFWRRWHITLGRFLRNYVYIPLGGRHSGGSRTAANLLATMLLAGIWHGAGWTFVLWGGYHGILLVIHRVWSGLRIRVALIASVPPKLYHAAAAAVTFFAVANGWVVFRAADLNAAVLLFAEMYGVSDSAISMADALVTEYRKLLAALNAVAGLLRYGSTLDRFWAAMGLMPNALPRADYSLAVVGLYVAAWIAFCLPNSAQIFHRFRPALAERPISPPTIFEWRPTLPWAVAHTILLVFSLLLFSPYSPFLYFQF